MINHNCLLANANWVSIHHVEGSRKQLDLYASLALVYQERSEVYQQCTCINHQKKTLGLSDCPVSAIVKTLKMETNLS